MSLIKRLAGSILLLAVLLLAASAYYVTRPLDIPGLPYDFSLQPGSSLTSVAQQLKKAGVIDDAQVLFGWAAAWGRQQKSSRVIIS
jgi:UPF0755 protein